MTVLSTASTVVRSAGAWTGGFSVAIFGTPGADLLTQAWGHLERGDYESARRLADNARRAAELAIAQAEAEVRRRRREEEERQEQERRRRRDEEAARQRRSSSSSSWGSSGSGTRSSSFRSGSGVSTSSW
jgi:membrane protein involved in colicin uptake